MPDLLANTSTESPPLRERVWEVARLFTRLGFIGFGGVAATVALMEDEVVARRGWLSRQMFLDLVGVSNLIPGPNAAELAIHIGYLRAGWAGFLAAGAGFVLPAVLISATLGWAYTRFGALPGAAPFLLGIKPAVLVVIAMAVWRLGSRAVKGYRLAVIGVLAAAASLLGLNEIAALFGGGLLGMAWLRLAARPPDAKGPRLNSLAGLPPLLWRLGAPWAAVAATSVVPVTLTGLGLYFLKIGAVLYGSGYVLIAFLQSDLVQRFGWLTQQQLLDAVAAGQVTPGPLLSTASFIGYLLSGPAGAALCSLAVFTPSFLFVIIVRPIVPRLRKSAWSAAFLDAINASSIGLMAAVTIRLALVAVNGWQGVVIVLLAAAAAWRWRLNSAWLVLGGAIVGTFLSRI